MKLTVLCFATAAFAATTFALVAPADESDEKEPAVAADRAGGASADEATAPNTLTAEEKAAGWKLLFDGETLDGWRGFNMKDLPAGWSVRDGAVRFDPPAEGAGARGDIITKKQYESFELAVDWAVTPGGNSGIFFRVSEDAKRTYETGPEFQVLDNAGHKDGQQPVTSAGSNYALHAPVEDVTRPVGEWNQARIKVEGAHVEHWLNGTKLLQYDLWTDDWNELVENSKFASMPRYGRNRSGHIALQDHGNEVRFRNLKIRAL